MTTVQKTCAVDCSKAQCPFVNDPNNPRRYVCLKCGLERSLDPKPQPKQEDGTSLLAIVASAALILFLLF
ncbi:hypothetical protein H6S82_02870 [Planktothrix sp. FACHB-1355]|uniref:Uncharacterized protein n=1 Tax=Aerosakkonema funiforme FACHB-1375 TaxID=2949571 RepID=A0A926VBS9_9CYAN|nr:MULTISPECIES: hypothetical protein [Oscillatoriales]MBD2180961.1 hypothetical protein [Aerosakkonema funiforme FACHB-1375]MBD3557798.1 hypothetical protein [Planktothrix sp. FACHB-1355]